MKIVLLPGLDGTGILFDDFVRELPKAIEPVVVRYPRDRVVTYDDLVESISLPREPFAILGESYGGPLAIRLAARATAVILVATFIRSPRPVVPPWMRKLIVPSLFPRAVPAEFFRQFLIGFGASDALIRQFQEIPMLVAPAVMAARLREVLEVDVAREFAALRKPVLYLRGRWDKLVPARCAKEMKKLQPSMETAVIDAPHNVLQVAPRDAIKRIEFFL